MPSYPATHIVRHRRENLKKCSLRGLETRSDLLFSRYPALNPPLQQLPSETRYLLLDLEGPQLSLADSCCGLVLLDATWRYAEKMRAWALQTMPFLEKRSLPGSWRTAYPRRQDDCQEPERGLASIEALYAAYFILGRECDSLLEGYHWKERFLHLNL